MSKLLLNRGLGQSILIHPLKAKTPILLTVGARASGALRLEFCASSNVLINRTELVNKVLDDLDAHGQSARKIARLIKRLEGFDETEAEILVRQLRFQLSTRKMEGKSC